MPESIEHFNRFKFQSTFFFRFNNTETAIGRVPHVRQSEVFGICSTQINSRFSKFRNCFVGRFFGSPKACQLRQSQTETLSGTSERRGIESKALWISFMIGLMIFSDQSLIIRVWRNTLNCYQLKRHRRNRLTEPKLEQRLFWQKSSKLELLAE